MAKVKHPSVGIIHMFVDTCVWLDMAKQADGAKVIALLNELSGQGKIQLVTSQIVLDEFNRNRDKVQETTTRSVSAKFREMRSVINDHGRPESKDVAINQLDDISYRLPLIRQLATKNFDDILVLLHGARFISPTAKMNERVVERALTKRAPFHRQKNSVADALLMEMYGLETRNVADSQEYHCFVTHNTKDFSADNNNEQEPHSDFANFFAPPYSRYFIRIQDAISAYLPDEINEFDVNFETYDELRDMDEVYRYLDKLIDQIWYNRHKNREHNIEIGKIKLVDKWQLGQPNGIQRDIWNGALAAAHKMEEKYEPGELGPWDDFEWGMLSGKMSAIRWMLGEDWESTLDT